MKVYIDHFPDQDEFSKMLKSRLQNIDGLSEVFSLRDLKDKGSVTEEVERKALLNSDIIIPIITSRYLAENFKSTETVLNQLSDNLDKTILPFIFSPANWSSKGWIVKSNVFPPHESFTQLTSNEQEIELNNLIKLVRNIAAEKKNNSKKANTVKNGILTVSNKIFISHSHVDADFGELLKLHLEKNDLECWIDNEKLKIGQDWREEIDTGISNSKAVIVIMSPEARKSEYVTYEWAYAWGKGIKILPIMLRQTPLHPRLESLQYMDFTNRSTRPYDELVARIEEIKTIPNHI